MSYIFLYGPSGVGKSTIGKRLAQHLNLPFVDLDSVIETNAGMSIPKIMEGQGERCVRDLETAALQQIVNKRETIIALGGGALLRDENRTLVEANGKVIFLSSRNSSHVRATSSFFNGGI